MDEDQDLEETLALVAQAVADFARPDAHRVRRVRDMAEAHDAAAWAGMVEQGWLSVLLPEEMGGTGLGMRAAALIAERLGYACHTEPFVAIAVMAARCLMMCPPGPARDSLLGAVAEGRFVALAWQPPLGSLLPSDTEIVAREGNEGLHLSGGARFVVPGRAVQYLVVARLDGQTLLCRVDNEARGLKVMHERTADGALCARLGLEDVHVSPDAVLTRGSQADEAAQAAVDAGVLCTSAELLGLMTRSLEITQAYLCERQQFGQSIGAFQILQHRLVDMWMQKELTRAAVAAAVFTFAKSGPRSVGADAVSCRAAASGAKARASEAALFVAGQAVQLHGAIGTTDEYELGVYVNRTLALAANLGNAAAHRRRFGALVGVEER